MDKQAVLRLLEGSLEMEAESISGNETVEDLPGWDSLAAVVFIGEIDEHFGITLEPELLDTVTTVADIISIVTSSKN